MAMTSTTWYPPSPSLVSLAIPYQNNQLADPQLWDSNFASISLFGMNKYLTGDAKNIMCLLYRIVTVDIPQISEFSFGTWEFISSIYKSGWNKLVANDKKRHSANVYCHNSMKKIHWYLA